MEKLKEAIAKSQEPAFRFVELAFIAAALGYTAYKNAMEVPTLRDAISDVKRDVAVLQSQYGDIKDALVRIENNQGH